MEVGIDFEIDGNEILFEIDGWMEDNKERDINIRKRLEEEE